MQAYTIDAKAFAAAVKKCGEVIDRGAEFLIMQRVVVAIGRGAVRLFAGANTPSGETQLRIVIPCPDAWRGRDVFTIDHAALARIVGAIKGAESLQLARSDKGLTIAAPPAARVFTIADGSKDLLTAPRAFPHFKRGAEKPLYECAMSAADWRSAFADVREEISEEETRYYLNGALVEPLRGEPSRLVATDGHRMAIRKFRPDAEFIREARGFIVHRETVDAFARIAGDDETVKAEFSAARVTFRGAHWRLEATLIDGTYPDYRRVMPALSAESTYVDAAAAPLAEFATIASKMSRTKAPAMRLHINGRIDASASNLEEQTAVSESLAYADKQGPDVTIGFNAAYVRSALRRLDSVRLGIVDATSPALFTSPAAPMLQRVLMPLRA